MDILHQDWAQGIRVALKAYSRASDAYAQDWFAPSVALWAVAIAGGILALEWLAAWRREQH